MDFIQRLTFEAPGTVMLGPALAAIGSGYAVMIGGQMFLTSAGERYLASCGRAEADR